MPFPSSMHESEKWKWSLSVVSDSSRPHGLAYQAPLSMGFSRQEYWSGSPLPSPHESCSTSQEVRPLGIHFSQETVRMQIPDTDLWEHCETRKQKRMGAWGQGKPAGHRGAGGASPSRRAAAGSLHPLPGLLFWVCSFCFFPGPHSSSTTGQTSRGSGFGLLSCALKQGVFSTWPF